MSPAVWWSRPLGPRALTFATVAALAAFGLAFAGLVAIRPADYLSHSDVPLYWSYGERMARGAVPYRDFRLEYPPGALPMFVLPATRAVAFGSTANARWTPVNAAARRYHRGFALLVLALGAATVVLTASSLAALRRPASSALLALAVVALSPLLIGDVYADRFDVWPAALTAASLAAAVRGRHGLAGALLGLGAATKIYPALLVPVLVLAVARRRGRREAVLAAGAAVATAAAAFLPFLLVAPGQTWEALRIQFAGGLQIESLGSAVLVVASHVSRKLAAIGLSGGFALTDRAAEHGLSRGVLVGPGTATMATVLDVLLALALLGLWARLARGTDLREDIVRYAAAAVATAVALGSVLSPQYVIWLIPLVPLVAGRRGAVATLVLALAAILTHAWFPWGYFRYAAGLGLGPTSLLLARDLALLATAAVLLWPSRARTPRGVASCRS